MGMDAGWEIFVSQMNFHVHQFVQTLCQLNVMKTASLVTWDGQMDVGWETIVSQWRIPVQWHVIPQCLLNVMKTAMPVIWVGTTMDAGKVISVIQLMNFVQLMCPIMSIIFMDKR